MVKTMLYHGVTSDEKTSIYTSDECTAMYLYLTENMNWKDGIQTKRSGFTRKAVALSIEEDDIVTTFVTKAITKIKNKDLYSIMQVQGFYLNWQRNGRDYTPNHTHPKSVQMIIHLGAVRPFLIAGKSIEMHPGDIIVFGGSSHGVPKAPEIKEGRIGVATFAVKLE
jgi:uncharacterized protein YcgL (UPF0745 family)